MIIFFSQISQFSFAFSDKDFWKLLSTNSCTSCDLSKANLKGAYLNCANLRDANLSEAHLEEAYLINANLENADLTGAFLERAHLQGASFSKADLQFADLTSAETYHTRFDNSNLDYAILDLGQLSDTNFKPLKGSPNRCNIYDISGTNYSQIVSKNHLNTYNIKLNLFADNQKLRETRLKKKDKGYIVGRVYTKLDGFNGDTGDVIEKATIIVAQVMNHEIKNKITIVTDELGYFFIQNQDLEGYYYPYSIETTTFKNPIESTIAAIHHEKGKAKLSYIPFSSARALGADIIDLGETIFIVKEDGRLVIERRIDQMRSVFDKKSNSPVKISAGSFGFPALEQMSKTGSVNIKKASGEALKSKKHYAQATEIRKKSKKESNKNERITLLKQAVDLYPKYIIAFSDLIQMLFEVKRYDEALSVAKKAVKQNPNAKELLRLLAISFTKKGQVDTSIPILESLIVNNPKETKYYYDLAEAYQVTGYSTNIDRLWENASQKSESTSIFLEEGKFYKRNKEYSKAIKAFKSYWKDNRDKKSAYTDLAETLLFAKRKKEAEEIWLDAPDIIKKKSSLQLGLFYLKADELDKAIPYFTQYLEAKKKKCCQ